MLQRVEIYCHSYDSVVKNFHFYREMYECILAIRMNSTLKQNEQCSE